MYKIMLFDSTNQVMMAESLLIEAGIEIRLVPIPREISSSCGVCVRYREEDEKKIVDYLSNNGLKYKSIDCLECS
ncbi:MAG: hypothetical protein CSA15_02330 [Candidatus Delongbacteria bacterium]|nr:MAG: hypothetical protein CSA15_02330 [Candidatus Delongbacteria bacterium]